MLKHDKNMDLEDASLAAVVESFCDTNAQLKVESC